MLETAFISLNIRVKSASIVVHERGHRQKANCLIKNLSEIDSLPHVRKLSEMPPANKWGVSQREVNDERKKIGCEGGGGALPAGE